MLRCCFPDPNCVQKEPTPAHPAALRYRDSLTSFTYSLSPFETHPLVLALSPRLATFLSRYSFTWDQWTFLLIFLATEASSIHQHQILPWGNVSPRTDLEQVDRSHLSELASCCIKAPSLCEYGSLDECPWIFLFRLRFIVSPHSACITSWKRHKLKCCTKTKLTQDLGLRADAVL